MTTLKLTLSLAANSNAAINGELPAGWDADLPVIQHFRQAYATRVASGNALNGLHLIAAIDRRFR